MNKKRLLAETLRRTGLLWLLEKLTSRTPCVLIVNYHRLGNRHETQFDQGVFSASASQFEEQLRHYKHRYKVLSCDEIIDLPKTLEKLDRPGIFITFDDGYRDNYNIGFDILRKHQFPAVFFIPTYILDAPVIPWWDAVSYLVNNARHETITIECDGQQHEIAIGKSRPQAIKQILRLIKRASTIDYKQFVAALAKACGVDFDDDADVARTLFMDADMIREMSNNNMLFGSHTRNHHILSQLTEEQQEQELTQSKQELQQITYNTQLIAYPVGGRKAFTEATKRITRKAGYSLGFSFYGGVLKKGHSDWFDVPRQHADFDDSLAMIRMRLLAQRLLNRRI